MSITNKFTLELAHFMAKSFFPSIVYIKFNQDVNYKNALFDFSLKSNEKKNKVYCNFISASNSYFNNKQNNFIKTPEQFLNGLIQFNMTNSIYTNFNLENGNKIVSFKSDHIPFRFLLMIKDFCPEIKVEIDYVSNDEFYNFENKWIEKIKYYNFSDQFLNKLLQEIKWTTCYSQYKVIKVVKAPNYFSNDCLWYSGDRSSTSTSTKKFIINSDSYESLVNPNINETKCGYYLLHSLSGGIDFEYMKNLPLYQLLGSFSMSSLYHDLKGQNYYTNSSEIDLTELTIFEEILKKEKAEIIVE
jgi:hypothetical protein